MLASALTMFIVAALGAALILRLAGLPLRSFLPSMTFGNAGNIGLPLAYFAFGDEGLGLSAGVFLVAGVLQFTLAPALQLGPWANSALAFFLILGFPIALIFAWGFELTPGGIRKERTVGRVKPDMERLADANPLLRPIWMLCGLTLSITI